MQLEGDMSGFTDSWQSFFHMHPQSSGCPMVAVGTPQ
jgi:hypothetical protein